jgi:large subunit ribosomal protein L6
MPIVFSKEVKITCDPSKVEVTGPGGHVIHHLPEGITVSAAEGKLTVHRASDDRTARSLHGLTRSLLANMVTGVTQGFKRRLEIVGVGFRADLEGKTLKLSLGFSHPVFYTLPEGIKAEVEKQTLITIKGTDRQQVGTVAAKLRSIKLPEPYKGKGIRYAGEKIKKKVGKTKA